MSDEDVEVEEFLSSLAGNPEFAPEDLVDLRGLLASGKELEPPSRLLPRDGAHLPADLTREGGEETARDIRALISEMKLPEKIKIAMFGNGTCRSLLIVDNNRLVQIAVLNNPKLQEGEVEVYAANTNVSDYVLRVISERRRWVKSYGVKLHLTSNPKTPGDIALKWLRYLNKADVRKLARSKNIPQLVSVNARKRLVEMEDKGK